MILVLPPRLTAADVTRHALVTRPFPQVHYYPGKSWAGRLIHEQVPAYGRRLWAPSWDEEWFAKPEEEGS